MKIAIGADHAGFGLKTELITFLQHLEHEVIDKGAHEYDSRDDYPDFIFPVAEAVARGEVDRGIVLGGSGQGEAIAANRLKGVRAVVFYGGDTSMVSLSREHNDANVLSLGARFVEPEDAIRVVKLWLDTEFSGDERHIRRIDKLDK